MLTDSFGRRIEYLRLSVTDRCNYRCSYCRPRACGAERAGRGELLSFEETERLTRLFAENGVRKVRLTGGEPLVRRDLIALAARIAALPGIEDLSLSTNGQLLEPLARPLRAAGVQRVNVSLDSLDPATFACITGGGDLARVLRGIEAARDADMNPVKLNAVVLRGVNDHEIESLAEYALARGAQMRYIEIMPVGAAGRDSMRHYYPAADILARLAAHFGDDLVPVLSSTGAGPARCYRAAGGRGSIGVVSAVSQHFCDSCNRVRLTARGELVLCLGGDNCISLREAMRRGTDDDVLKQLIYQEITRKPERHDFLTVERVIPLREMSFLGG